MTRKPDLSIVIVSWNTRGLLSDCLRSVERSIDGIEVEIIVVDNASDDDSVAMVRAEHPAVIVLENPTNQGFAAANNRGFRHANGRHVLLLNSDTLVSGDVLARAVRYLDVHPAVGALGVLVKNADGSTQDSLYRFPGLLELALETSGLSRFSRSKFFGRYRYAGLSRDRELDVDTVSGCCLFVPREVIERVGGLDESFYFYGEETDWCRRIRRAGFRVRFAPLGSIVHFGSGSARRLNHRRDLLLTSGLIRLHRKHSGRMAAAAAAALLFAFNASRACFWFLAALSPTGVARASDRRDHFVRVVREFASTWPKVEGVGS